MEAVMAVSEAMGIHMSCATFLFLPVRETEAQGGTTPTPGLPLPPGKLFPANFQSPAALTGPSGSCSLSGL